MLVVKDLNGKIEALTDIRGDEIFEEINGEFSLSFSVLNTEKNAHSYPLLEGKSIIEWNGHEFRVGAFQENNNRKIVDKALHVFFDLNFNRVHGINGGTKTVDEFFEIALKDTGWTFENVNVNYSKMIPNFGNDNTVSLIRLICSVFECEIKIEPNRHLKIQQRVGIETDHQFRYKYNIKSFNKKVDTSNLATVIKGYGGNGLEVTYTSPNVDLYGKLEAEPYENDNYTIAESLIEKCKQELIDYPEVTYDLEITHFDFTPELGDSVWTIYEPMNVEFKQRIMGFKYYPFSNKVPVVTLTNKKDRTYADSLTQVDIAIKENQKQTITKFEQTNKEFDLRAEKTDESVANLNIRADQIVSSVEEVEESVAAVNIRADNINLSVQDLSGELSNAQAQISVQAGQISSKVEQRDYNGNTIASLINQEATGVTIEAPRIDLLGIANVSETLTIGSGYGTIASIRFNGNDSWINTYGGGLQVSTGGNFDIQALNMTFTSTVLDLSTARDIRWGSNAPTNVAYASNAAYAQSAGSTSSLGGYSSSDFVKDTFNQGIGLYIDNSTGRLVVRRGSSVVGSLVWN